MDLNVAVPPANELFEDNDMVFPILLGRENLKILASPGSESSGVSSLDAEEAKKLANEQLPTSNSPTLTSEPSSAVQTESESSDGSSDGDDDKPIEQSSGESVQSADECEQQSNTSDDDEKDDVSEIKETSETNTIGDGDIDNRQTELVSNAAAQDDDNASIDLDAIRYENLKILYEGRDILDFSKNVANKSWHIQYAHLPEQNYQMYIQNRSQYNRLAPGYESPEHYALNACGRCAFQFPVMVDVPDESDQATISAACKSSVNDLLIQTVGTIVNALAQKLPTAQPMAAQSSMHTPIGPSMSNLNNFMMNNNAATSALPYAYQNRNQFANNANIAAAAAAAAAASANNHSCFKQNNTNTNNNSNNAFYGNNLVLNALVNQIGNNMNSSSAFNSNFMNAIIRDGTNTTNPLNQLNNATLANLMNQNRQLYGMCRQNINKSGINFNASSHKQMPTYSHF